MQELNYNHFFMFFILFIGIILTYISWDIDNKLQQNSECASANLKNSNKLVLVIGVTFVVSALSFFTCSTNCSNVITAFNFIYYIIALFVLAILLIVLGSIISAESTKSGCSGANSASSIWILGLIIMIICLTYFYYKYKNIIFEKRDN